MNGPTSCSCLIHIKPAHAASSGQKKGGQRPPFLLLKAPSCSRRPFLRRRAPCLPYAPCLSCDPSFRCPRASTPCRPGACRLPSSTGCHCPHIGRAPCRENVCQYG